MELHPAYDPDEQEWFVEHEDSVVAAPTLAELKAQFPTEVDFIDYHPVGYKAVREGSSTETTHKPFIMPKPRVRLYPTEPKAEIRAEPSTEAIPELKAKVSDPEPVLSVDSVGPMDDIPSTGRFQNPKGGRAFIYNHEKVLNLVASGLPVAKVAEQIGCSIETVAKIKKRARAKNDPRGFVRPTARVMYNRERKNKFIKGWTAEDDAKLRHLAEVQKLTAGQIGLKFGVSKNSIIGRCHRKGIQLQHPSVREPRFHEKRRRVKLEVVG